MENKMENRKQGYNPMKAVSGGDARSEKKQTVTITEDLKVVVKADNGALNNGVEHVCISGEFVISADSVARLVAALEGKNVQYTCEGPCYECFILGDKETKEFVSRFENQKKEFEEQLYKCEDERYDLKRENNLLKKKIKQFNDSRFFWERKFKIEDK